MKLGTLMAAGTVAVASLALAACGSGDPLAKDQNSDSKGGDGGGGGAVVVGGANFTESKLLAEIYAGALRANGVDASTRLDIGSREIYLKALEGGAVDIFPEYTGNLAVYYASQSDQNVDASSAEEWYDVMTEQLPDNLAAFEMSPAQNNDSVAVSKEVAQQYDLKSIADLKPVADQLTIGGPPEWRTRPQGLTEIKKVYGIKDFAGEYRRLKTGLQVQALKNGRIDVTNIFTTNPAIFTYGFVILDDPKGVYPLNNVVPIVNSSADKPKIEKTLNKVSAKLDTKTLSDIDKQVDVEGKDLETVAKEWLSANGLN